MLVDLSENKANLLKNNSDRPAGLLQFSFFQNDQEKRVNLSLIKFLEILQILLKRLIKETPE